MIEIRHNFNSLIPDDPEAVAAGEVLPSHWNEVHSLIVPPGSLVGNSAATPGAAEAISVSSGLSLVAGVLSLLGTPLFVQEAQPTETGPYLWAQLLPAGELTIWVNDLEGNLRQLQTGSGGAGTVTGSFVQPVAAYKVVKREAAGYEVASSDVAADNGKPVGITVTAGSTAQIQFSGKVTNPAWSFTPGQRLFLGLNGELTSNPFTGFVVQQIAVAESANSIFITPSAGIRRA